MRIAIPNLNLHTFLLVTCSEQVVLVTNIRTSEINETRIFTELKLKFVEGYRISHVLIDFTRAVKEQTVTTFCETVIIVLEKVQKHADFTGLSEIGNAPRHKLTIELAADLKSVHVGESLTRKYSVNEISCKGFS